MCARFYWKGRGTVCDYHHHTAPCPITAGTHFAGVHAGCRPQTRSLWGQRQASTPPSPVALPFASPSSLRCRRSRFLRVLHWSCLLMAPSFVVVLPVLRLYFVGNMAPHGVAGALATVLTCVNIQLNVAMIASEGKGGGFKAVPQAPLTGIGGNPSASCRMLHWRCDGPSESPACRVERCELATAVVVPCGLLALCSL